LLSNYLLIQRYTYSSAEESGSVGFYGYVLDYLEGGGYVVDINLYPVVSNFLLFFVSCYVTYNLMNSREDSDNGSSFTSSLQQLIVCN
jgi:hypothetical protein